MTDTTVLAEEATFINEEVTAAAPRVAWGAIIAGALVAVATTLFLLFLGSGFGLQLVSRDPNDAGAFLTLGAIYFLAAQAFGLAAGGHVTGRLIGPAMETAPEEEFRAGAHGLAVWALAVVVTISLVAFSALVAEGAAMRINTLYGAAPPAGQAGVFPETSSYWVDTLFRPATTAAAPQHAALDGIQYAQNETGTANDGTTAAPGSAEAPADTTAPAASEPPSGADDESASGPTREPGRSEIISPSGPSAAPVDNGATMGTLPPVQTPAPSLAADKAEVGHILDVGLANGGYLPVDDRDRIAQLIAQDASISYEDATLRVNKVQAQIHDTERQTAETARRLASHASLWIAFALLFGAIVSVIAAVSARWEDDMQTMFRFGRPAPLE